jgi:hypothetical protein
VAYIYNYALFHWKDSNGMPGVSFLVTQDQGAGGAGAYTPLSDAAQACCDAAIIAVQFCTTVLVEATPTEGDYGTVWDRAALIGRNTITNKSQRSVLVGPKADIFLPDRITVDLTDSRVIDFNLQVQALLGDSLGNPCGPFIRGVRSKASGS